MRAKKLNGFTLTEVLVTLALTSISITFAYSCLNICNKWFRGFMAQRIFISQYSEFQKRMLYETAASDIFYETGENKFKIVTDSLEKTLFVERNFLVLSHKTQTDTFRFDIQGVVKHYEPLGNPLWKDKLVGSLEFDVRFDKQTYHFRMSKLHDASVKLMLETQNENEQH